MLKRISQPWLRLVLASWLLLVIPITVLCGLLYVVVQQQIRQAADDPQIQLAEDAAAKLAGGQSVQAVVPAEKVDIARSVASYVVVFDAAGKPVASSGQLDGQDPTIPGGVFDSVRSHGEDRITWQPRSGVRSAVVVVQWQGANGGFVLAGRSLREPEQRIDHLGQLILFGWIGILLVTLCAAAAYFWLRPKIMVEKAA